MFLAAKHTLQSISSRTGKLDERIENCSLRFSLVSCETFINFQETRLGGLYSRKTYWASHGNPAKGVMSFGKKT